MSDLDADLYGDLYETDFPGEAPEDAATHTQSEPPPIKKPAGSSAFAEASGSKGSNGTTTPASTTTSGAPSAITSVTSNSYSPPTQKIPTYEQPQTNDYRNGPPRSEGDYQNIPVNERSIRPSEMKDEG
ncbi:hypothetical protein BDN72DRAFT_109581 [Pluteus cervinus]|uniref:Uncharacterized protein n=1 Tax=Pluteus cervinus TaxID=181527 RepID=A0ACD3AP24_9AGAR|nr:hypothetical protein BDN72DRAFT_109581 [Pluteus cervinus]